MKTISNVRISNVAESTILPDLQEFNRIPSRFLLSLSLIHGFGGKNYARNTDVQRSELSPAKSFQPIIDRDLEKDLKVTKKDLKLCIQLAERLLFAYAKTSRKVSWGWLSCLDGVKHFNIDVLTVRMMYNMSWNSMGEDESTLREKRIFFPSQ